MCENKAIIFWPFYFSIFLFWIITTGICPLPKCVIAHATTIVFCMWNTYENKIFFTKEKSKVHLPHFKIKNLRNYSLFVQHKSTVYGFTDISQFHSSKLKESQSMILWSFEMYFYMWKYIILNANYYYYYS